MQLRHLNRFYSIFVVLLLVFLQVHAKPCQDNATHKKLHEWAVSSHREFWTLIGQGAGYEARNGADYQYVRAPNYYGLNYIYLAPESQHSDFVMGLMKDRGFTIFFEENDDEHMFKYITILKESNDFITMGIDLKNLKPYAYKPGVKVWKIETDAEYDTWIKVMAARRGNPKEETQLREFYDAFKPSKKNPQIQFYLGSINGEIVGSATLYYGKDFVSLYSVGVHPNHRRHGLGSALSYAPLKDAQATGYRWSVLQAQPDGVPVYPKLGFEKVGRLKVFYHIPNQR